MPPNRFGTFAGGIDLPDEKAATLGARIAPIGPLERLRVPLAPAAAAPARPVVRPGQRVSRGDPLGQADDPRQVDVFAPAAGQVAGLARVNLPAGPDAWRASPAVEIADCELPADLPEPPVRYEWQSADDHSLRLMIAEGGLVTFRHPAAAVALWIAEAREARVDTLIANVTENTPFITADHRLLAEQGSEVARGLAILARAIGVREVFLAVDRRRTEAYRAAVRPAGLYGITAVALPHKYPTGADAMIVKVLTRREIPPGGSAPDVGAAVTDGATCWAAYRWVARGELPTARVVTVGGPKAARGGNFMVPFGADAGEVLARAGAAEEALAVCGPAMQGTQLVGGAVVGFQTNALLALEPPREQAPTACIRCGWCGESCPAMLNVAALNDDFELGRVDRARRRLALACVDCGICSYLCPARLPLARRVGLLKQAIRAERERPERVVAAR